MEVTRTQVTRTERLRERRSRERRLREKSFPSPTPHPLTPIATFSLSSVLCPLSSLLSSLSLSLLHTKLAIHTCIPKSLPCGVTSFFCETKVWCASSTYLLQIKENEKRKQIKEKKKKKTNKIFYYFYFIHFIFIILCFF
jgi:hypothetical protein